MIGNGSIVFLIISLINYVVRRVRSFLSSDDESSERSSEGSSEPELQESGAFWVIIAVIILLVIGLSWYSGVCFKHWRQPSPLFI